MTRRRLLAPALALALALAATPAAALGQGTPTHPLSLHQARAAATRLLRAWGSPPGAVHRCQRPPRQPALGCWVTVPARMQDPGNPVPYARVLVWRHAGGVCAGLRVLNWSVRRCWR